MTKYETGLNRLNEILGGNGDKIINDLKQISEDFAQYVVEFAYADLYTRKGISDKTRELVAVASLIGQGNTGIPVKAHLEGMLNVGWTKKEIIEILIFLIGYVGFPPVVDTLKIAHEIFNRRV
jgi:4-carboxymuconolactone decarboxylase